MDRPWRRWLFSTPFALSVLIIGLALTWFAWRNAAQADHELALSTLRQQTEAMGTTLRNRLLTYEALLYGGSGLISASDVVTAEEWRIFSERLRLAALYPGLQGLGYAARLSPSAASAGTASRDRTSITYLEPQDARNRAALGYDMMEDPVRRTAMERARDTGEAALSARVRLVQEITASKQPGFLIYLPVYRRGFEPSTVEERRQALLGFVYCPFRSVDFIETVIAPVPAGLNIEVFDGNRAAEESLLFRSGVAVPAGSRLVTEERAISMMGHRWLIRFSAAPEFLAPLHGSTTTRTAILGTVSSLLMASICWALALSRQRLAQQLRADEIARQRDWYAMTVLENSLDAYVAIDAADRIIEWNRQAETVFGWSRREACELRLVDTIIPPAYRGQHLAALGTFGQRPSRLVGRRIEMPALRRDGTEIKVELSIVPTGGGDTPLFVASMRDITELRQQEMEIRQLNITLEDRVATRTIELAEANRELAAANEGLEAFTQNVSHDLRAPLRVISGYAEMLRQETAGILDQRRRDYFDVILRNTEKMRVLIDDFLKLARIGQQPVQKRRINLDDLAGAVIEELRAGAGNSAQISQQLLGDVHGDPALLQAALRNLLSNAIKFTRRESRPQIVIASELRRGERVFFIKDNGVGFDSGSAQQLFKAFHTLHSPETFPGTGIGLTIVKTIIDKHGGRIWAESEPGKGATFFFTLPDT